MSKEAGKGPGWRKGGNHKRYREGKIWKKIGPDSRKKKPPEGGRKELRVIGF